MRAMDDDPDNSAWVCIRCAVPVRWSGRYEVPVQEFSSDDNDGAESFGGGESIDDYEFTSSASGLSDVESESVEGSYGTHSEAGLSDSSE
jgi:hypothetical protein